MLKILVVDNDKAIRETFKNFFRELGYTVFTAFDNESAMNTLKSNSPEIMIVDYELPNSTGLDLIKKVSKKNDLIKFILISDKKSNQNIEKKAKSLGVIEFIPKPVSLRYVRNNTFPKILALQFNLEKTMKDKIATLEFNSLKIAMNALESKDKYTEGHSKRVMQYCVEIAEFLPKELKKQVNINKLMKAGLLHDIGKIGLAERILNKREKLTDNEFEEIKKHPVESERILEPLKKGMEETIKAIKHHHERYNGSGYPDRLKGNEIPLMARIMTVADSYDAMTSDRAYRRKRDRENALNELQKCASTQFDPVIVDAFIKASQNRQIRISA